MSLLLHENTSSKTSESQSAKEDLDQPVHISSLISDVLNLDCKLVVISRIHLFITVLVHWPKSIDYSGLHFNLIMFWQGCP